MLAQKWARMDEEQHAVGVLLLSTSDPARTGLVPGRGVVYLDLPTMIDGPQRLRCRDAASVPKKKEQRWPSF
jgi:hypothetical protein